MDGGWSVNRLVYYHMRQYVLEIEYTLVIESTDDDPDNVCLLYTSDAADE